jgi:glutamate-1-semialdehyde 2,1-aminomutase
LKEIDPYEELDRRAAKLEQGLSDAAAEAGIETTINRVGSMLTTFFTDKEVTDWPSAKQSDTALYARFFRAMLEEGVYLAPSQFECAFVSLAHIDEVIDNTISAARTAMSALAGKVKDE